MWFTFGWLLSTWWRNELNSALIWCNIFVATDNLRNCISNWNFLAYICWNNENLNVLTRLFWLLQYWLSIYITYFLAYLWTLVYPLCWLVLLNWISVYLTHICRLFEQNFRFNLSTHSLCLPSFLRLPRTTIWAIR